MLHQIKVPAAVLALTLTMSTVVNAASTAEIKVTGKLTPAACTPVLSSGGIIALGNISKTQLQPTQATTLSEQTIDYTITCDAPAKIVFSITDMRASSVPAGAPPEVYGLGFQNGSIPIGFARHSPSLSVTLDGAPGYLLTTSDNGATWRRPSLGVGDPSGVVKWGFTDSGNTPKAATTYSGSMRSIASITKADDLDFTSSFDVDGLAIFEIFYL